MPATSSSVSGSSANAQRIRNARSVAASSSGASATTQGGEAAPLYYGKILASIQEDENKAAFQPDQVKARIL